MTNLTTLSLLVFVTTAIFAVSLAVTMTVFVVCGPIPTVLCAVGFIAYLLYRTRRS